MAEPMEGVERAALSSSRAIQVVGGPGTGKTQAIVQRAARLLAASARPDDVLVLAATRSAADVLRARVAACGVVGADAVEVCTPAQFFEQVLSCPEARAFTGRTPRLLADFEERILMEDMKTCGLKTKRMREMLQFFFKQWTELGDERDYYKEDSAVQRMILRDIAEFSDFPQERIELGIDGCGVPVFAVPLHNMATSFVKLVAPELLQTPALAHAAKRNVDIVSRHPENLMDANATCGVLCRDPNIIGKVGAQGVYTFGLKKERLGFACKVYDGQSAYFPLIIAHTLELLSYDNKETIERLRAAFPDEVTNATGAVVGIKKAAFSF